MRTVRWFLWSTFYVIFVTIFRLPKVNRLYKNGKYKECDELTSRLVKNFARGVIRLTGSEVNIEGFDNIPNEACLFVGNHQGNFDVPVLLGWLDRTPGFVAKIQIKKIPLIRTWMKYIYCVFINRSDARQSLKAILDAAEYLKNGQSITIFPEGTRSKGGPVGEFKPGSLKMALKTNTTIVPFAIKGSYNILEKNKGFKITPATVTLHILKPIFIKDLTDDAKKNLSDDIRNLIITELEKM